MNIARKLGYIKLEKYNDLEFELIGLSDNLTKLDEEVIQLRHNNHVLKQTIKKNDKLISDMEHGYANIGHRLVAAKYVGTPLCLTIGIVLGWVML